MYNDCTFYNQNLGFSNGCSVTSYQIQNSYVPFGLGAGRCRANIIIPYFKTNHCTEKPSDQSGDRFLFC